MSCITAGERPSVPIERTDEEMAIDAKVSLIGQMEKRLESEVTVEKMRTIINILKDVMDGYEIEEIISQEQGPDDMIDCFIDAKQVQGLSKKTLHRYRKILTAMLWKVKVPTKRITVHHLRKYLAERKEAGVQASTIEGERQIFSSFFNWLQRESLIDRNPIANLGAIKTEKKVKKTYSDSDIENMRRCCKKIRDRALLETMRSTGCRISEVMGLTIEQVDLNNMQCVVHGKGNKERIVYLDAVAAMCIRNYLATRKDNEPELFRGQKGKLTESGVRYMLAELEKASGVDHIHPHKFRRTLATELSRRGMPIQEISRILGHEKIDTSMTYIVLNDADVKHDYRKYA